MAMFSEPDYFDDEEEQLHFSNEPYMYEPEYTDEELREMDLQRVERESASAQAAAAEAAAEQQDRRTGDWWCQCRNCKPMENEEECFCCREWDLVIPHLQELELDTSFQSLDVSGHSTSRDVCITEHQDFLPHLNHGVLETFFSVEKINWKKRPRPAGPNGQLSQRQYRLVAYRLILEWALKGTQLGRGQRRVLPSCVVTSIRNKYPSTTGRYVGFREAQDALTLF